MIKATTPTKGKARKKLTNTVAKAKARTKAAVNPLMQRWAGKFQLPPFERIETRHFKPALEAAFRDHRAEIEAIASNASKPTFANTIVALEKAGKALSRVASVFHNLEATDSTPELQELAREVSPRFASHETKSCSISGCSSASTISISAAMR